MPEVHEPRGFASNLLEIHIAAKADEFYALWVLLLTTGMRPGEALALTWDNIEGNRVSVQRALTQVGPGRFIVKQPKTARSRRRISIPDSVRLLLAEHRNRQARAKLRVGRRSGDGNLVFANELGRYLDPSRVSKRWRSLLKTLALPSVRLYDLRHTHATHVFEDDWNPKVVQERLGHSSITLTLDTYTHVAPKIEEGVAEAVGKLYTALQQARMISQRTKDALAAAKARGVTLGNPDNLKQSARLLGSAAGVKARQLRAEQVARDFAPIVEAIRASGSVSLREIAAELNRRGIPTARGRAWSGMQVGRLLHRLDP